jgi:VIT1/CCC1 family predicted Fe2+/Mn2+ transporter
MDGLVSNTSLIAGVAGGGAADHTVLLTGLAGLVGGALSMAGGEWTSVRSQNEATEAELDQERVELTRAPASEEAELVELWRERGLDESLARAVAHQLHRDPETALRVHAQEELGVDPDKLPSPWQAAGSSFVSFVIGAFVPLAPYLVGGTYALLASLLCAAVGLFVAGAVASRFTSRSWVFAGARQLLLGAVFAGITYVIGDLVGAGT